MEDISFVVGKNLKKIREEKKLSLEKLASLTGVSKSMLGQVERGVSSPTIAVVWKIVNGLNISFTTLVSAPQPDITVIPRDAVQPLVEDKGRYHLYPYFPIEIGRSFEIYSVEVDAGGSLDAEAHPEGTQEFINLFSGELTLDVDGREYQLKAGDAIRFRADCPHAYHNLGDQAAKLSMVIHYPRL